MFAPTDDAFAALGLDAGTIATVPQADLTNILLYHVAYVLRYAEDVVMSDQLRMLNGGFVAPERRRTTHAQVRMANIIVTDVPASNGHPHAIDSVLLPGRSSTRE